MAATADAAALPERLNFREEKSFPWTTITTRMPVILTQVIDQVHKRIGATVKPGRQLSAEETAEQQGAREGLSLLSKLKREMQTNKPLLDLDDADLGADREAWNTLIRAHRAADGGADGVLRWYDASWLLAECYLYRRIRGCMLRSSLLASFDPFEQSKRGSYHKSIVSITALADFTVAAAGPGHGTEPEPGDQAAFDIMVQFALWGNKTDLSLRPTLNTDGGNAVKDLQVESTDKIAAMRSMILCNHADRLWATLGERRGQPGTRVDIVLDNAGFELYTDLCLAHWLTQRGFAETIVFHTKCYPWFVSDTMDTDFHWLLAELRASTVASLATLGEQFSVHLSSGRWQLRPHRFWTLPHEFGLVGEAAPELKADMDTAHVIILKGDLNYRKLLADRHWPHDADFGTVAGGFSSTTFCSLRTLKANLVCGLAPAVATRMQADDPTGTWLTTGEYGIIQGSFKSQ